MGLLDRIKKAIEKKVILTEHGVTWTEILSWMITEDYNNDLQFPQSIQIFDEMRKSDATTIAVLRAIKNPLLSAKWQIQAWGEETKDIEIWDFVRRNLFENIKFKRFLREAFAALDFGFYYFEKNFKVVDGMIEWKEFAPRIPKAHDTWEIKGKPWRDWHPAWITQIVNSNDEETNQNWKRNSSWVLMSSFREIPWEKLILFTIDQEWNNFEGVSVLRSAYKHYFYKNLSYKVQSISNERFGVWIPIWKTDQVVSSGKKNKLLELVKNIRSNEKSYWIISKNEEVSILTPEGWGVKDQIKHSIDHHDMKIYDAILAWFLNLTTWDWWSNALSKDQSSFFLRGLQWIADDYIEVLNDHIKELVDLNFNNIENYPKLTVSDIWTISLDELVESITKLHDKWLLDITIDDRQMIRDIVKFPRLTNKQISELEKEREEKEIKEQEEIEVIKKQQEKEKENNPKKEEDKKMAEEEKKKTPTKREKVFTKNITEFEKFLERKYKEAENIVKDFEKEYQDTLIEIYENADTERIDWVVVLKYNKSKVNAWEKKIDDITKKLEKQLINSKLQKEIFDEARKKSIVTMEENEKLLAIKIDSARFDSFVKGYTSNMQGVLFNESRRMKENIVLNFWSEASQTLAIKTAKETTFNKNILRLSFVTHPRTAYKNTIYDASVKEGFTLFKVVVPANKIVNVAQRPSGKTFSLLYLILTAAVINERANRDTQGKTAEAVSGLWLHHGSFEYYYPIESNKQPEEEEIAKEQRRKLKEESKRINSNKKTND